MLIKTNLIHQTPGLTDICYTNDGKYFLSCGQDGDIHIIENQTNQIEHIRCADQCYCLVIHESHLFIGTNRHELEVRSFPTGDCLPSLIHLTQPVSTLCLDKSFLFVGTRDFQVIMFNLNEDQKSMKYFQGHQGPILSLSVHSKKRFLSTACCDGFIRIYHIDKQQLIKQFNLIDKSNDIEKSSSLVKTDWDLIDDILSIPVKNSIHFYESNQWTKTKIYQNEVNEHFINLIRYSSCGNLFVVAYQNGEISIVDRLNFNIKQSYSVNNSIVCSLSWNPIEEFHQITCTTMAGEYFHINYGEFLSKISKTKIEMEKDIDIDNNNSNDRNDQVDENSSMEYEEFIENKKISNSEKIFEYQEAFQSTSTSKYLESRFLIWNSIGVILCYNDQIQIKFHDVSYHHSITIDNKIDKYSIGDLSLSAIVLGSNETNQCLCLLYQSWDSNMKQWNIQIEKPDQLQLVKLTENYLIIGTSMKLIRLFTLSGIQQRTIRCQGSLINISCYLNQLWIIHHSTMNLPKEQALSYTIIDLDDDFYLTNPLSLTSKSKLIWTGYSDSGQCFYLEKSGHLTLLRKTKNRQYEPLLIMNLKQEAERNQLSHYWLLGINDFNGHFQLRVIELRNQSYPDLVPWPLVQIISPSLIFNQIENEKNQLENDYLKLKLFSQQNQINDQEEFIKNERQCLIKMFALSCKSNREYRAFEICQMMDKIALELAIKYATKSGKLLLAQKITDDLFNDKNEEIHFENQNQKEIISNSSSTKFNSNIILSNDNFIEFNQDQTKKNSIENKNSFINPFKKKINLKNSNPVSTNDEFSQWKPTINKINLSSSNKSMNQNDLQNQNLLETEEISNNGKRKIIDDDDDETNHQESSNQKRNKLRQFACHR